MLIRKTVISAFLVVALAAAAPGHAGNVSIKLRIANPTYFTPTAVCPVTVAENSDGATVLGAAKTSGCIQSYVLTTYSFGRFLSCINNICGDAVNFWAMRENYNVANARTPVCPSTDYGIDDFRAAGGDELSFTYETAATFLVPGVCPA